MKALHVFPFFGSDLVHGAESHAYMLSKKLVEQGVEVDVLTTRSRKARATSAFSLEWTDDYGHDFEESDGIRIFRRPHSVSMPAAIGRVLSRIMFRRWHKEDQRYGVMIKGSRNLVESYHHRALGRPGFYDWIALGARGPHSLRLLARLMESIKSYDVVLVGFMPFTLIWQVTRIAKFFKKPVVLLPLFHPEDIYHHFAVYYRCFSRADAILAQTTYSLELFQRLCPGVPAVRVGPGVDDRAYTAPTISGDRFRMKYGLTDKKVVLYVGRKEPSKRYDLAVQAIDLVAHEQIKLVMVGADADRKPIASRHVLHLGALAREELLDAYDGCDVFLLPSEHESFGMVFLEAWMRKKPVIGNAFCKPVASMIRNAHDGYVCADAREMAHKIVSLMANPAVARNLGEAGYRRVMEQYTWDVIARKVYRVYDHIVNGAGRIDVESDPSRPGCESSGPAAAEASRPADIGGDKPASISSDGPQSVASSMPPCREPYNREDALRFPLNSDSHDTGFRYIFDFTVAGRSLNLRPGAEVLDFASGSCFVSELLNRLGYVTTALDADASILAIGRERLVLDPRCDVSRARFVSGEGMRLPFRPGSFDGIVCMNALHHMPDYRTALAEMYRVLKAGGRAVFSEPGNEHSKAPQSINAMKQYGVLEKDVELSEIHRLAKEVGFQRMVLKPYVYPEHVDLSFEELEPFRKGDRVSTANVSHEEVAAVLERGHALFYLEMPGEKPVTSATARPELLRARLSLRECPVRIGRGQVMKIIAVSENNGESIWLAKPRPLGGHVSFGVKLLSSDGRLLDDTRGRTSLSMDVPPRAAIEVTAEVSLEGLAPGRYRLLIDMVNERVCWFQDMGSEVVERPLEIV